MKRQKVGKLVYPSANGHEVVTEDKRETAMKLFGQGYQFYENQYAGEKEGIIPGNPVRPEDITEDMDVCGLRRYAGG